MNQKQIFGLIILLGLIYLSHKNIIKLTQKEIIFAFIIHISIIFLLSNNVLEGLTATSNEAVQNLGSVYNTQNATLTNLQVTGTLRVGNSILMNGDSTATNKIEIYQNSDRADPKMYFDKTGKLGTSGTAPAYISSNGSLLSGLNVTGGLSATGDLSTGGSVVFEGRNKWLLHTPHDGRKTLYIAPYGKNDWNWGLKTTIDGNTGRVEVPSINPSAPTGTSAWQYPVGAYIGNGRGPGVPLPTVNGKLEEWEISANSEDYVMLMPGFGIKLWNRGDAPNYKSGEHWKAENTTNNVQYYDMYGSNQMDYFSVYRV